jgi:catechol 2,3-dioxygenase-like lactoylglutathione lyase family enzyme
MEPPVLDQRVGLLTLGVRDLARAKAFYERLGWRGQEVQETVFFQAGGMAIVLWSRDLLADDAGVPDQAPADEARFEGMAIAQNVRSPAEVDAVLRAAAEAGARITRPARETFYGGYAGYFADPEGHVWEIAYNPGFTLNDDGTLSLPDFGSD